MLLDNIKHKINHKEGVFFIKKFIKMLMTLELEAFFFFFKLDHYFSCKENHLTYMSSL